MEADRNGGRQAMEHVRRAEGDQMEAERTSGAPKRVGASSSAMRPFT